MSSVKPPLDTPTRDDLLWTAGFLEAEGHFRNHGGPNTEAKQIGDATAIVKLARLWGGNIDIVTEHRKNHRGGYRWRAHGYLARNVMREILPFMSVRRKREIQRALGENNETTNLRRSLTDKD